MSSLKRTVVLVADGLGVGAAPDAKEYGDEGSNTLGNLAQSVGGIRLPNLQKLGIGNLGPFEGIPATATPEAVVSRLAEKSQGKDTTTGHWEIAGCVTETPFALFPQGFPNELVDAFVKQAELPGVLGNVAASGTAILGERGKEHIETGKPILYTSGDSVFQIAAHEEVFGLDRLYRICEIARGLTDAYRIGRVIARPFVGSRTSGFSRTERRRDYSVAPPPNLLDLLVANGIEVQSVGKIDDIFDHRGISESNHTGNNLDSLKATSDFLEKSRGKRSLTFVNLVDFDQLFGHRRDPSGYGKALAKLDSYLPKLLSELDEDDCLILTGDHGCDPTFKGTDHTREYVPLVAYRPGRKGKHLGDRTSFSDIAASIVEGYQLPQTLTVEAGSSFLCEFSK